MVIVAILLATLPVALSEQHRVNRTQVNWFNYEIAGGPSTDDGIVIFASNFCAPNTATNLPLVSLFWYTVPNTKVEDVRLWTLLPPNPTHLLGVPTILYQGLNSSVGGGSFPSGFPFPCGEGAWDLDDNATSSPEIDVLMTLTYNYTAIVTTYPVL